MDTGPAGSGGHDDAGDERQLSAEGESGGADRQGRPRADLNVEAVARSRSSSSQCGSRGDRETAGAHPWIVWRGPVLYGHLDRRRLVGNFSTASNWSNGVP